MMEINAWKYEKTFLQVQHPPGSTLIDSISMDVNYYPATSVDDSIHFKSAYVVGELRSYTGNWDDLQNFYNNKILEDGIPVLVMPTEVYTQGQQIKLDIARGFIFGPSEADIFSAIRAHYDFWGSPQGLNETEQNLYLVYSVW